MTAVSSAAKMVGQLRRWLTGEESVTDGDSVENVCGQCDNCARNSAADKLQYRGRSYSDCCAVSCRGGSRDTIRERSCSVNSRWMTSQSSRRVGSRSCQTSSGTAWLSGRQRDVREVLDEDPELCRCWSGSVEPVCCCERCFVYVDEPAPVLPPPYTELMLLEHCANLAKRLTSNEPSITAVNTAAKTDQVMNTAEAAVNCTSLETCQLTLAQSNVASSSETQVQSPVHSSLSTTDCLPPSVHASLDGEEGYTESQQRLCWARRQRLHDDTLTRTACPPPNRTIGHVVDCW